ncbi:PqqD family peptide modification chaperone [Metabacillus schmidteae]|uniref:PqqD family peptide modification chaperone n=1 Tax=Metabacillus schmidteae TaxID=2730405 RepID=UPI00158D0D78|nr:PqqD family peptide modification chaperone [Metabacillus schmidteae]
MINKKPMLDYLINIKKAGKDTYLIRGRETWVLNDVAEEVCMLSTGKNTVGEMSKLISTKFNEEENVVQDDIKELLLYFEQENIIKF